MTKMQTDKRPSSKRAENHAAMLEAALARPGVGEIMKVYGGWREKDQVLETYRSATKKPERITTTDSSRDC